MLVLAIHLELKDLMLLLLAAAAVAFAAMRCTAKFALKLGCCSAQLLQ
jgi:hypothetical protein